MDQCPDPEAVLERALEDVLDDAIEDAKTFGIQPTHAQIYINSTLLEFPMKIRLRKIADNPIWSIVNLISKYNQQSAKNGSLFGAPIEVDITTAQCHSGCGRKKNAVRHNINTASLIEFENEDNYCLFYALELGCLKQTLLSAEFRDKRKYLNKVKKDHVLPLMEEAHIPLDLESYDAETWIPVYKIFVFGSYGAYKPAVMGQASKYQHAVCVFHEINELGNHFHTIGCINRFFKDSFYCLSWLAPYDRGTKHASTCKARCFGCSRVGPSYPCPKEPDFSRFCDQCFKKFGNQSCYDFQLANKVCDKLKKCTDCGVFYSTVKRKDRPNGHRCGKTFCKRCHTFHDKESGCFIQKKKAEQETVYRLMVYDFESEQALQPVPDVPKYLHEVNFVAAYIMCTKCISAGTWKDPLQPGQCDICGDHRNVTWGHRPYFKTTVDKQFVCENPLSGFLQWSLNELNPEYETYAYAHFGGRYDMTLTLGEIIQNTGILPEMVRAGLKMYKMDIVTRNKKENPICQTRFRDSFNLIPVALDKMVKTFKLDIESKYDFPHLWNCQANYGVTLPHLPGKEFYCYGGMKKEKQAGFDDRYAKEYNTEFLLDEKLPEYCVHDVRVLAHSLVSYRQLILDVSHDDVLCHSPLVSSKMDYLYYPIKNGNMHGKVPCFYYPGTWYTLLVVDTVNRQLHADAPHVGAFIVKRRWAEDTEVREYIPYSNDKRREVHDELHAVFDTYKAKYDEYMSCSDFTKVGQGDVDAAHNAEQLNPQRFYYPPDSSSARFFEKEFEMQEEILKGAYYFFTTRANGEVGKFPCFIYPGPFYKIIHVNDSNARQHNDVPSSDTYVYRYNARKDIVEYATADKDNIARVHRELHLRFEHYRRMFLDYVATLPNALKEDIELAEKIGKKQRFFSRIRKLRFK